MTAPTQSDLLREFEVAQERDREKYHGGPNGSQTVGPIGMEGPDGNLYCVGCWWCAGGFDEWIASRS